LPEISAMESPSKGWVDAEQTVTVYPSDAVRFKVTHEGTAPVLTDVAATVSALDQYGPGGMGKKMREDLRRRDDRSPT